MYQLTDSPMVLRTSDGLFIPPSEGNQDYLEYLAWLDEGNTPQPPVPPAPPVPQSVTRRQGRLALLEVGKLAEVEALFDSITDPVQKMAAQIEYEADTWELRNPFLQNTWAMLSDPKPPLEDLFVLANTK